MREFAHCIVGCILGCIFGISIEICIKVANIWPKHSWLLIDLAQRELLTLQLGKSSFSRFCIGFGLSCTESAYIEHTSAYLVHKHRVLLIFGTGLLTEFKESCSRIAYCNF